MKQIYIVVLTFVAAATAGSIGHYEYEDYNHHPDYKYEYSVHDPHTHDIKSQHESRHGDVVKGYYKLKEADGTVREVHYTADHKNGFNAKVHRSGKAHHPEHYKSSSETFYGHGGYGHGHAYSSNNNNLYNYGHSSGEYHHSSDDEGHSDGYGHGHAYSTNNNNLYSYGHSSGDYGYSSGDEGHSDGYGHGHATSTAYLKIH